MSKRNALPGYYGNTHEADANTIADAAMRAYGHPWKARATLMKHGAYLDTVGIKRPREMDNAIDVLVMRASGEVVESTGASYPYYPGTCKRKYDAGQEAAALGGPLAESGSIVLRECEVKEMRQYFFGVTLHAALVDIAECLYKAQLVRITTKGGKEHWAQLGEVESAMRKKQTKWHKVSVMLYDAQGKELTDKAGVGVRTLNKSSIASVDRSGVWEHEQ